MSEQNNNKIMVLEVDRKPPLYITTQDKIKQQDDVIFIDVSKNNSEENVRTELAKIAKRSECHFKIGMRSDHELRFDNKTVILKYDDNLFIKINPHTCIYYLAPTAYAKNGAEGLLPEDVPNDPDYQIGIPKNRVVNIAHKADITNTLGYDDDDIKEFQYTYDKNNKEFDIYDKSTGQTYRTNFNQSHDNDILCNTKKPSYWSNINRTFNNNTKTLLDKTKSLFGKSFNDSYTSNLCCIGCGTCDDTIDGEKKLISLNTLIGKEREPVSV